MTEPSVNQMMDYLKGRKRSALLLTLMVYSLIFAVMLVIFYVFKDHLFGLQFIHAALLLSILFLLIVGRKLYIYNYGAKNQTPYYGGIYVAYYKCTKCESLFGGIFGKGPTQKSIIDMTCRHDWHALTKDSFDEKYQK